MRVMGEETASMDTTLDVVLHGHCFGVFFARLDAWEGPKRSIGENVCWYLASRYCLGQHVGRCIYTAELI